MCRVLSFACVNESFNIWPMNSIANDACQRDMFYQTLRNVELETKSISVALSCWSHTVLTRHVEKSGLDHRYLVVKEFITRTGLLLVVILRL